MAKSAQACAIFPDVGKFVPYFQPVVYLQTGKLAGFEILARWEHPDRGLVLPAEFIERAEHEGWIGDLTRQLLTDSLCAVASLPELVSIALNISPIQLHDLTLPRQIDEAISSSRCPRNGLQITIEITESALIDNLDTARTIANELKEIGCQLAIDDFGTGYSSLLHLQALPFDIIKVDRSFVSTMAERRDSRKIVAAVIGLAESLGMRAIAEGVEGRQQAELLYWLGCNMAQGWLYGPAIAAESLQREVERVTALEPMRPQWPWKTSALGNPDMLPAERLAQLQAVYDGAPVGLAFLDKNMRYLAVNQRLAAMNGQPVADHLGCTVREVVPEVFSIVEPFIEAGLKGLPLQGVELHKRRPNPADDQYLALYYQPAEDEAGEVVGLSVAAVDITERKQMEIALRDSEHRFRSIIEGNPEVPWIIDAKGNVLDYSSRWYDRTGLNNEQTIGHGWLNAILPEDLPAFWARLQHNFATGEPIDHEVRVRRADGSYGWMRTRGVASRDQQGAITHWYGSIHDVDDYHLIADDLRDIHLRKQAIVDAVPFGILYIDAETHIITCVNDAAREIYGDHLDHGMTIEQLHDIPNLTMDGRAMTLEEYPTMRTLLRREKVLDFKWQLVIEGRPPLAVVASSSPVHHPNGTFLGAIVIFRELDKRT